MALSAGFRLGHYEIGRALGAGGMGEVYAARDTKLGREVAIKVLPPRLSANPDDLERFTREARTVATLNHPNIVTLHSVEQDGNLHFLTMELVSGRTLAQSLPNHGLAISEFFRIPRPVSSRVHLQASRRDRGCGRTRTCRLTANGSRCRPLRQKTW